MADRRYEVLFLCTGNSARSILAEALLNHWGRGRFRAHSAGSQPTGKVNPGALRILAQMRIPAGEPHSKSWQEFAGAVAPQLDFVFTVCDSAAAEACPVWPGQPLSAHWGVADPAAVRGDAAESSLAFRRAFHELEHRIRIFASLPIDSLDRVKLQRQLDEIGAARAEDAPERGVTES